MKAHHVLPIAMTTLLFACNGILDQKEEHTTDTVIQPVLIDTSSGPVATKDTTQPVFNINSIPVSAQDLGTFPFFNAPEGYKYQNADTKDFDKQYLAVNGKLIPFEGKVFNADLDIDNAKNKGKFNAQLLAKSYDKVIVELGGVKLNAVPVATEEMDRIGKDELVAKKSGYALDYNGRDIHTYVIRQKDAEVWIQFSLLDGESGRMTILQKGDMETLKITLMKADDLKKEIDATGKAILHINFDTDKTSFGKEGDDAVTEIKKLLQQDGNLKLSIEGHTDNTGNAAKNKQLSLARANAVMNALVKAGIRKDRLKAVGYGSEKPVVDNNTDEGKAQNRRVELVKL
ncbi:outer membrane protein OmpA-like peptidoglycan-associated protein [Filimonas zeae]|uniref:OmpA-like domain-containing protein n=1 Tax=Filimonas zeae TaxID=1737353 RepID=A0A917IZW0_9BACT|nr:OmpA family protein [Filimonas zeae]MDR6338521.1 outer membrane protein OmpA-like peptidoglycan-associated protein [Filimonas zeae]GGH67842.1 hypothetical protein GCM10011379_23560 [Filimonas zeae]